MTTTEKANLINQDANLAFIKLINNANQNSFFLNFKRGYEQNGVFTTAQNNKATEDALIEMLEKGLI